MKPIIQEHFNTELFQVKTAIVQQDFETAWTALQRAHILGQRDVISHLIVHWNMLKLAWKQRDFREIAGQIMPTILAVPLTLFMGKFRTLRGGKVNINDSERMSIPEDIQKMLER